VDRYCRQGLRNYRVEDGCETPRKLQRRQDQKMQTAFE